jgi:ring-1,2-phenylacetyl-CoA epoxidase subunit PaaD
MHEKFAPDLSGPAVACPYCDSNETELFSLFGQQLLTLQYYCHTCHTPFEYVKDDGIHDGQEATQVDDQASARSITTAFSTIERKSIS